MNILKNTAARQLLKSETEVLLAFVFGSEARGRSRETSDIDVAILLKHLPGGTDRLSLHTKLSSKLSKLFKREADIVILNTSGSILKYQVAKDGQLLFERSKGLGKQFALNAIKEYFDYLPTFNFHYERLKARSKANG